MPDLSIRLLGQFSLSKKGEAVPLRSRPAQLLLAYLVLNLDHAQRREKVAGVLWPDSIESNARSNLRHALYRLKKILGDEYFNSDRSTLAFNTAASYEFDVQILEDPANEMDSVNDLIRGVAASQGELLPGFYEEWVVLERERLGAVFDRKMDLLLERLVEAGRWADCLEWGERWIALGQTPEPAYRALMQAHGALGDTAAMAATYRRCVKNLNNELGVEPSAETRALYEALADSEKAKPEFEAKPDHNLPAQVTSFVGRERQLSEIVGLIKEQDIRLVTLTGPGGIGKTRLGIQAAYALRDFFDDGIHFVNLVPIRAAEQVIPAIAASLGMAESGDETVLETLTRFLKARNTLLILDNFEQVIEAAAEVGSLLRGAPRLKLLVTSREGLRVYGESEYSVPPLSLPASAPAAAIGSGNGSEAVELFGQRARSVRPQFVISEENAQAIHEICVRLDGLPLAIELAAARTKLYNPQNLLAELERSFDALQVEARVVDEKRRTLRATIDWSYNLLEEHEKTLFARLSVFRGGHTIEAAEEVCQTQEVIAIVEGLESLHNKSLLLRKEGPFGEPRFGMLETIHEYAAERLDETGQQDAMQRNHALYFVEFAEKAEPELSGREQASWYRRLEADYDNFRVVLGWSFDGGDPGIGMRLTAALRDFWNYQGHSIEGMRWVGHALEQLDEAPLALQAKVLICAGHMYWLQAGNMEQARSAHRRALSIQRQLENRPGTAWSLIYLAYSDHDRPEKYEEAKALCDEALAIFRELEDKNGQALALNIVGELARVHGDLDLAQSAYEESLELCRKAGDQRRELFMLLNLAMVAISKDDPVRAETLLLDNLSRLAAIGSRLLIAHYLAVLAGVAGAREQPLRAAALLGAADSVKETLGMGTQPADQIELDRYEDSMRQQLSAEAYDAAYAAGRAMTIDEAVAFALDPDRRESTAENE